MIDPLTAKVEVRECATLGTNFADVYVNGKLFARELSRPVAETFSKYPDAYPNAFADEAKLRTWNLERWDSWVVKQLAKGEIHEDQGSDSSTDGS